MCLGLPGKIIEMQQDANGNIVGRVSFPANTQQVSLSYLPDVRVGDYVLVHYGFATECIAPEVANSMIELRRQLDRMSSEEESE